MDNKNEFQELLEKLLKEQEAKLTKQFEKRKTGFDCSTCTKRTRVVIFV